jgi:hypothetical protein
MIRYTSFQDFASRNDKNFSLVVAAKTKMKSITDLSITGQALDTAEELAFEFLNLKNIVTDLMFGLSASVLDAKTKVKEMEGICFRDLTGSAADRARLLQTDPRWIQANQTYNDLLDLSEYLTNKSKDFETNYYYYRGLSQRS